VIRLDAEVEAQSSNTLSLLLHSMEDYPIFEVEAPQFSHRIITIPPTSYAKIDSIIFPTSPFDVKESTGLTLASEQIIAIHSAQNHIARSLKLLCICHLPKGAITFGNISS